MLTLESIGFTKEELQQKVVDQCCAQLLETTSFDEDGEETVRGSALSTKLNAAICKRVDDGLAGFAEKHILPNVTAYLETLCLQETSKWGEKVGQPMTFLQYLTQRADAYLREEVSYDGKTKGQESYSWKSAGTRVSFLVEKHLQYAISTAMGAAVKNANESIVGGLEQAVRIQLKAISEKLAVDVKIK